MLFGSDSPFGAILFFYELTTKRSGASTSAAEGGQFGSGKIGSKCEPETPTPVPFLQRPVVSALPPRARPPANLGEVPGCR